MPNPTLEERLKGLVLSANELRQMTDWPTALIEDYLSILNSLKTIAGDVDTDTDDIAYLKGYASFLQALIDKNRTRTNQNERFFKQLNDFVHSLHALINKNRTMPRKIHRVICDVSNPAADTYRALNTAYQNKSGRIMTIHLSVKLSV